jgi:hypothetical protein
MHGIVNEKVGPGEPVTAAAYTRRVPGFAALSDDSLRRARMAAQLLHRPRRSSPVDLVRHLTGVQAQVLSSAGLALRARTEGLTAERVDRARLRDRSIVRTWALRGTLHLVAAEDYRWLVPLVVEPALANARRRLRQEGVTGDQPTRAVRLIERMLHREGPLTRPEIAERLRRRGIRTEGQAIAHIVWLAAAEGMICHGPDHGDDPSFILVRDWIGPQVPLDREAALAELAARYLAAHCPAEPADLASWSGIRLGDARRAWRAIEDRVIEVETTQGPRWTPRGRKDVVPAGVVRLLPSFDEYLLGWRDRGFAVAPKDWKRINRGGGWLHPVVLADGRAVGTWRSELARERMRITVEPFSTVGRGVRGDISAEGKDIGRFLGADAEISVSRTAAG